MRFERLDVWQRAARLSACVYRSHESPGNHGFKDQIARASLSIASNIAEGYERETPEDRVQSLRYAKSACAELRTQIYIGIAAGFIARQQGREWIRETGALGAMLHDLITHLRNVSDPKDRRLSPTRQST